MSLGRGETYQSVLRETLREAKFSLESSAEPRKLIGLHYRFGCEHGSHHSILVGTIQAIEVSDEGGLELYVSNPLFWGEQLVSINYSGGKWLAHTISTMGVTGSKNSRYYKGEFEFI